MSAFLLAGKREEAVKGRSSATGSPQRSITNNAAFRSLAHKLRSVDMQFTDRGFPHVPQCSANEVRINAHRTANADRAIDR
jgi:hypothetical protein